MKFSNLLQIVGDEPIFETNLLAAGNINMLDIQRQLSRWTKMGKLYQLRRGLYALAPPHQKIKPHPFLIANRMITGSYVSCQSALAYYGLIPEHVPVVISVTTRRPHQWHTHLGTFKFRHIKTDLFYGYKLLELTNGQSAYIAKPEKALLDLIHYNAGADSPNYLLTLRLQNLDTVNLDELQTMADMAKSPKLKRSVQHIIAMANALTDEYITL